MNSLETPTSPSPTAPWLLRCALTTAAGETPETFEVVASEISMEPTIHHGDTLFVSKEVELIAGRVVVAIRNDQWIVKRLASRDGALVLRSDDVEADVALEDVTVQGVVVQLQRTI